MSRTAPPRRWDWALLALLLIGGAMFLMSQTRNTIFADDEWLWILHRRGGGLATYLEPHNSHLSLVPIIIYKLLFARYGIRDYTPFRAVVTAAHLGVVALLFTYLRTRIGGWLALLAAASIMLFGPGWQDFLWAFQMAWLIALGAGIAALLALDRNDRLGDVLACLFLGVALGSAGPGIAVAAGLTVDVALRGRWRRLWVVAAPIGLYALWWINYQQTTMSRDSVFYVTRFMFSASAGVLASFAGLSGANTLTGQGDFTVWGAPLLALAVVAVIWRLRLLGGISARIWALLAVPLVFWLLTALARGYVSVDGVPLIATGDESRYLYVGAVMVLLLFGELYRSTRLKPVPLAALSAVAVAAVIANVSILRAGAQTLRAKSSVWRAQLGVLDMTRDIVSPDFAPSSFIFGILTARDYFGAERAFGTPAMTADELAVAPDVAQSAADGALVAIHRVTLTPTPVFSAAQPFRAGASAPVIESSGGGTVSTIRSCVVFKPGAFLATGAIPTLALTLPAAGLTLEAIGQGATVSVRRFSQGWQQLGTLIPGEAALLRIGPDGYSRAWHVSVQPSVGARVCTAT